MTFAPRRIDARNEARFLKPLIEPDPTTVPERVSRILDPMLTLNIQTPQVPGEITLNWTDFVTGEDGWRVQRSSDGVNFNWYHNVQIAHGGGSDGQLNSYGGIVLRAGRRWGVSGYHV